MKDLKDPLTKREKNEFFKNIREAFDRHYESLLLAAPRVNTISCDKGFMSKGSHVLAKIALQRTATDYRVVAYKDIQKQLDVLSSS